MNKLTIEHYLNKKAKPRQRKNGVLEYPIYVKIVYKRNSLAVKSSSFDENGGYIDNEAFNSDLMKLFFIGEKKRIERVVIELDKTNSLKELTSKKLGIFTSSLRHIFENNFSKLLISEVAKKPRTQPTIFFPKCTNMLEKKTQTVPKVLENATFTDIKEMFEFTDARIYDIGTVCFFNCYSMLVSLFNQSNELSKNILDRSVYEFLFDENTQRELILAIENDINFDTHIYEVNELDDTKQRIEELNARKLEFIDDLKTLILI